MTIYRLMLATVVHGGCDDTPASKLFPRQFGGDLGDTELLAWDFKQDDSLSISRMALGGKTSSGDIVTHPRAAWLAYEDAENYQRLWDYEIYYAKDISLELAVTDLVLDVILPDEFLYVAISPVLSVWKMNAKKQTIMFKRVIQTSPKPFTYTQGYTLHGLALTKSHVLAYFSDPSQTDYLMTLFMNDMRLGSTHEVFFGVPNTQAMKQMKVQQTMKNKQILYVADFIGKSSYYQSTMGIQRSCLQNFFFEQAGTLQTTTQNCSDFGNDVIIVTSDLHIDQNITRLSCLQDDTLWRAGGSTTALVYFLIFLPFPKPPISQLHQLSIPTNHQIQCREALITSDKRNLLFANVRDQTQLSTWYTQIYELFFDDVTVLQKQVKITEYGANLGSTFFKIHYKGALISVFNAINSFQFQGQPEYLFMVGHLDRFSLDSSSQSCSSALSTFPCGSIGGFCTKSTAAFYLQWEIIKLQPIILLTFPWNALLVTNFIVEDNNDKLQQKPLCSAFIKGSGCKVAGANQPSSIKKYLPYIEENLYYIIGVDPLSQTYNYQLNQSYLQTTTDCEKKLLSYEIRRKHGIALPGFIQLNQSKQAIIITDPYVDTFDFQLVLRDIYGYSEALDFTLRVEQKNNSPSGIANCYTQNVVKKGWAPDVLYIPGTLKFVKLDFSPDIKTSTGVDCSSLLALFVEWIQEGQNNRPMRIPFFMTLDQNNRRLQIFLSSSSAQNFLGKTFIIRIKNYIRGNPSYYKTLNIKIGINLTQPLNSPLYYPLSVPEIPDYLFRKDSAAIKIAFKPFQSSGPISNRYQLKAIARLTEDWSLLPLGCLDIKFSLGIMDVNPSLCQEKTYQILLNVHSFDPYLNINYPHQYVLFKVEIVPALIQCYGYLRPLGSGDNFIYLKLYSDIDAPQQVNLDYKSRLLMRESPGQTLLIPSTNLPSACSNIWMLEATIFADNGLFDAPQFAHQPFPTQQSIKILTKDMLEGNQGFYDLRLSLFYSLADPINGRIIHPWILMSQVRIQYEMFQTSKCRIDPGQQSQSHVTYYISRKQQQASQKRFYFKPFVWLTDGCIYDTIRYSFESQIPSEDLPVFVTQDQANISISVKSGFDYHQGDYLLKLVGELNPHILVTYPFKLTMDIENTPNTDAPRFKGSVQKIVTAFIGLEKTIKIPKAYDPDYDSFNITFFFSGKQQLPDGFSYEQSNRVFSLVTRDESLIGKHKITIELKDLHRQDPKKRLITIELEIRKPLFSISSIDAQDSYRKVYVGVKISQVLRDGTVSLHFNTSLFTFKQGIAQFNNQSFSLMVQKAYSNIIEDIRWEMLNVTERAIKIQLKFKNTQSVSNYFQKDRLQVIFEKGSLFISNQDQSGQDQPTIYLISQPTLLSAALPRQDALDPRLTKSQGLISLITKTSVGTLVIGNMAINIFLASSIQLIWGMINSLQLIVLITLFNFPYPSVLLFVFRLSAEIIRFNILPTGWLIDKLFEFSPEDPERVIVNSNFEMMGYDSTNIVENLDTMVFLIFSILTAMMVALVADALFCHRQRNQTVDQQPQKKLATWFRALYHALFFNTTLRIILEGYLEITLAALLNLLTLHFSYFGDQFCAITSVLLGLLSVFMPLLITAFLCKCRQKRLQNKIVQAKFGSLYMEQRPAKAAQLYHLFFTLRRFALANSVVFLSQHPTFQGLAYIVTAVASLAYVVAKKPFRDPKLNRLEAFNELCILAIGYCLLAFTDWVDGYLIKDFSGYLIIGIILFNFACHILLQCYSLVRSLGMLCKSPFFQKLLKFDLAARKILKDAHFHQGQDALAQKKWWGKAKLQQGSFWQLQRDNSQSHSQYYSDPYYASSYAKPQVVNAEQAKWVGFNGQAQTRVQNLQSLLSGQGTYQRQTVEPQDRLKREAIISQVKLMSPVVINIKQQNGRQKQEGPKGAPARQVRLDRPVEVVDEHNRRAMANDQMAYRFD